MSDWVDLRLVVERLADNALLELGEAGARLQGALRKGEIRTRTPGMTSRPSSKAEYHDEDSRHDEDYEIPPEMWESVHVDWTSRHPYYRFYDADYVRLSGQIEASRSDVLQFLRRYNEVSGTSSELDVLPEAPTPKRGAGGRRPKYDWARAAGYLAGFVVEQDWKPQAELVRELTDWFGADAEGTVPDTRDVERFVSEMLKAKRDG